jgi:hypothetical protein
MWQILVIIMLFAVLGKPTETFQNEDTRVPISNQTPIQNQTRVEPKKTEKKKPYVTSNHVSRDFVRIQDEFKNPLMNCPQNYEIANEDILETQQLSEYAFGYTKNEYLDRTRFVDTKTLKEPLPVNPDFFMT